MGDEIDDGVLLNIAQREAARGGAPALLEVFLGFLRRRTGESRGGAASVRRQGYMCVSK